MAALVAVAVEENNTAALGRVAWQRRNGGDNPAIQSSAGVLRHGFRNVSGPLPNGRGSL